MPQNPLVSWAGVIGAIIGLVVGIIVIQSFEPVFILGCVASGYVIGWILTAKREPEGGDPPPTAEANGPQ